MSATTSDNIQSSSVEGQKLVQSQFETILKYFDQIQALEHKVDEFTSFHLIVSQQVENFSFFGGPAKLRAIKQACARVKFDLKL